MRRRKLLIGMGSLAAGGAAAMGTGAFTSVQADRSVTVTTASDSDAFLAIRPMDTENAEEYVHTSGGTVNLDFGADDIDENTNISGEAASGLNKNATTIFDDLLAIQNQGTQPVYVGYTAPASNGARKLTNANFALYHEDPNEAGGQLNIDTADSDGDDDLAEHLPYLAPGQTLTNIGAYFFGTPDTSVINNTPVQFVAAASNSDILEASNFE